MARRALLVCALLGAACGDKSPPTSGSGEAPPWASAEEKAAPRPGMVWVPPGLLIAGTPVDRVPRVPDTELPGQPIPMEGFYVDIYLHPNEPGSLPTTGVTQEAAQQMCMSQGKRLCSELELERACKGDANQSYPYGEAYKPDACGTGKRGDSLSPNGFHAGCVSPFGVHDTHGSVWSWTSSNYARGTEGMITLKGGNSAHGELVGRCAHVHREKPTVQAGNIGFRCCAGAVNLAAVDLGVKRGQTLHYRLGDEALQTRFEEQIAKLSTITEGAIESSGGTPSALAREFRIERVWTWHPLGNEELLLGGGCSLAEGKKRCGVFVAREVEKALKLVTFVSTERWQPTISEGPETRSLHMMGGDDAGAFRKLVAWDWGKVAIFGKERKKSKRRWVPD